MTKLILTLALTLTSVNAFAGAYVFECTDANHAITIEKSSVYLRYWDPANSGDETEPVEYTSKSMPDFATEKPANPKKTVSVEIIGKKKQIVYRNQTDECGNVGKKDIFVANLVVRDSEGKLIANEIAICDQSFYPGHCY